VAPGILVLLALTSPAARAYALPRRAVPAPVPESVMVPRECRSEGDVFEHVFYSWS